jgi:RNA polymerase sigma-70 factor (ECF subfamily)
MSQAEDPITQLLARWSSGERAAADELMPLVYDDLRRIALRWMRRERPGHTLQATAVVHEAFLHLSEQRAIRGMHWIDRAQFYGLIAHLVRRVLVDHARRRNRSKRGGGAQRLTLAEAEIVPGKPADLIALEDALCVLEKRDPRKAAVVEMRFFGGLTGEEIAAALAISPETVGREWRRAKAWLLHELQTEPLGG